MKELLSTFIMGICLIILIVIAFLVIILWWQFDTWFTALVGLEHGAIIGDANSGTMGITRTLLAIALILLAGKAVKGQ